MIDLAVRALTSNEAIARGDLTVAHVEAGRKVDTLAHVLYLLIHKQGVNALKMQVPWDPKTAERPSPILMYRQPSDVLVARLGDEFANLAHIVAFGLDSAHILSWVLPDILDLHEDQM